MTAKNQDYHKKLYRLVRILNRLEMDGKVTPRQLADEFNVSMRTAQRDLELINMADFPLVAEAKGSYSFMPGFSLKKVPLTEQEASLLAFICEVSASMGGNFAKSFKSLLSKVLLGSTGESPFQAIQPTTPRKECPAMAEVQAAIEERDKIKIHYANGEDYRLRPLKLIYAEGFWYLFAEVDGKNHHPKFRLDRISSVERLHEPFTPPKNLKEILSRHTNIWFNAEKSIKVVLRISGEVAPYFKAANYFPSQKVLRTEKDGALLVETKIGHFMEVLPIVKRWIPHIKVIEPEDLKEEVKRSVRSYLEGI